MSAVTATRRPHPQDLAVVEAQHRENVLVGNEIVRHKRISRVIHWSVALTFFVCVFTGMPIWTPVFGWMAHLFGGLTVCRLLPPWAGLAYTLASLVMFFHWMGEMHFEKSEKGWLGPKLWQYMRYETEDDDVGKYNGGQKVLFWAVSLGALGLLASGILMWFPLSFPKPLMQLSYLLHDFTFIMFGIAIVGHVYLGTAAEPGTFGSMTRGTVTRAWARLHHPRWYREVTGEDARRR